MVAGEAVHRLVERLGDAGQRRGRGDRQRQLPMHVADQTRPHTAVAAHTRCSTYGPCNRSRTAHARSRHRQRIALRSSLGSDRVGRPAGPPTALCGSYTGPGFPVTVSPRSTGAPKHRRPNTCLVGLGRSPVRSSPRGKRDAFRLPVGGARNALPELPCVSLLFRGIFAKSNHLDVSGDDPRQSERPGEVQRVVVTHALTSGVTARAPR